MPVQKKNALLKHIEITVGYKFKDLNLLKESLVHRSYANEGNFKNIKHNERLEFLGDAILGLAVSELLLKRFPDYSEGELSKHRASIVNEEELSKVAIKLNLGKLIFLGRGEELTAGRTKSSILAGTFEALLAAIYLDGGYKAARQIVKEHFHSHIANVLLLDYDRDFKTRLQQEIQARFKEIPNYVVTKTSGPDHRKIFEVRVSVQKQILAFGSGKSKKEAEQDAARSALRFLQSEDDF